MGKVVGICQAERLNTSPRICSKLLHHSSDLANTRKYSKASSLSRYF